MIQVDEARHIRFAALAAQFGDDEVQFAILREQRDGTTPGLGGHFVRGLLFAPGSAVVRGALTEDVNLSIQRAAVERVQCAVWHRHRIVGVERAEILRRLSGQEGKRGEQRQEKSSVHGVGTRNE